MPTLLKNPVLLAAAGAGKIVADGAASAYRTAIRIPVVGDRIASEHWAWKVLYFPIVGFSWVLPLKPLLRWMHAKDAPHESPDV